VADLLAAVARHPLSIQDPDLRLDRIPATDRIAELEFLYPVERLTAGTLRDLFGRHGIDATAPADDGEPGRLDFAPNKRPT